MLLRPWASGPQDSRAVPYLAYQARLSACWLKTWVSIWLTAGGTSTCCARSTNRSGKKLETPMARTLPAARAFSMAR